MALAALVLAGDGPSAFAGAPSSEVSQPLTGNPGDALRGRDVVLDRDRGHCLLCHRIDQVDASFQGNIGPALSDVGSRLDSAELRQRIVDPTRINPDTAMPAYYRVEGLRQVARPYRDRPVLTAQEVEDVIAFLSTLRAPS